MQKFTKTKVEDKVVSVHFSDTHFMPKNYKNLYNELKDGLYTYIEDNGSKIDVVFLEGDYFHEKLQLNDDVTKTALKFFFELVELCNKFKIKLRVIRGTRGHDFDQLENFRQHEEIYDLKIYNTVDFEELFDGFNVLYLPEEYMDDQKSYYSEFFDLDEDSGLYDMIVFHGTFDFTAFESQKQELERQIANAPIYNSKEMLNICYGPIIGGHIHQPRTYKKRIMYNGSYSCTSFDEHGEHGFIVIDQTISDGTFDVTKIQNKLAPKYITLEPSGDKFANITIDDKIKILEKSKTSGDHVRIKVSALNFETVPDLMLFREKANELGIKLDIKDSHLIDITKSKNLESIKDIIEDDEEEDTSLDFITDNNLSEIEVVQKFIKENHNIDLDIDLITEIMTEENEGNLKNKK